MCDKVVGYCQETRCALSENIRIVKKRKALHLDTLTAVFFVNFSEAFRRALTVKNVTRVNFHIFERNTDFFCRAGDRPVQLL